MTARVVAITGVNGFVAQHAVREFSSAGYSVIGIGREPDAAGSISEILQNYFSADLAKEWPVMGEVDVILHLAGLAAVGPSFEEPQSYIETNSRIVTHMAEAILGGKGIRPRIIGASSGVIYGGSHVGPVSEDATPLISSPYVVSKLLVENQLQYYRARGLPTVVVRPFNHIGPGQGAGFILPDLIASVREAQGRGTPLSTGNLSTIRDYTDVRDVVRAYRMLADVPALPHDVYNVCSGVGSTGEQILELVFQAFGADAEREASASHTRPTDPSTIVGDCSRLAADTGWRPTIPLERSVRDAVAAGRE